MRWPRWFRRRRPANFTVGREAVATTKVGMSIGWWLTHFLVGPDGTRSKVELLVEPDEIGPMLKVLERNGVEQGRSATIRFGVGQTGAQRHSTGSRRVTSVADFEKQLKGAASGGRS